jgi:uncharacterized membrane protein YfcA
MQLFIVAATISAYLFMGRQWFPTLLMFLVMEFGAVMGAAFGSRMRRKAEQMPDGDDLPLKPGS